ncbi:GDP-mannose 4,6-dehydratase, partial [Mycobacterium tuberculosis]|nr:GDP-mannose 4,6-dehydratase [Mycobacterium tuberculosis]
FEKGYAIVGVDNDMRKYFFGEEGSTEWNRKKLEAVVGKGYTHHNADIRDSEAIGRIVRETKPDIVIHTAAQPSHDWA